MKHAYLIEAHSNFEQLLMLIKTLDCDYNDIYIHIDKKSEIPGYLANFKTKKSKLLFLEDRKDVQWGSFNQIAVECALLKVAIQNGNYSRFHLLSGVDFPIKSQKYIYNFFEKNKDKEFVHIDKVQDEKEINKRVSKYFVFIDKYGRKNKILNQIQNGLIIVQKFLNINRIKKENRKFYKGSNWFSITNDFANYIIENEPWIFDTFKKTKCCDEIFVQTLLMNSKYRKNLYYSEEEQRYSCLRYVDWNRGNPYVFTIEDYQLLLSSECIFARKFDLKKDEKILNKLMEEGKN